MEVVLGIDIGGTFTKFGLVDRSGKIYFEGQISSREHATIEQFIASFHQHLTITLGTGLGCGLIVNGDLV